jgi:hypothetical protein
MKQSSLAKECVNLVQESFIVSAPGVVLTTLYDFRNLHLVPIKLKHYIHMAGKACQRQSL